MSYKTAGILGALVVIISGGLLFRMQSKPAAPQSAESFFASPTSTQASLQPPNTTLYKSAKYSFTLFYPNDLSVSTYPEVGGASTITFQNVKQASGFQVFIVPYDGDQISQERFEADDPSGVRENPTDITVDGTNAAKFYSKDTILGDTVEIWFLKNHFLFEVSAPKSFETALVETVSTWHFF